MPPKKAIIIILTLLILILGASFAASYFKKRGVEKNQALRVDDKQGLNKISNPAEARSAIELKIKKIIEAAEKDPASSSPDEIRSDILSAINGEIMKLVQNKTPEQIQADLEAQRERQKAIDGINAQIKKNIDSAQKK